MFGGFGGGMGMGSPLLMALLSGGLGYAVGSGAGQQQMNEEQNARIGQLEQQQPVYAPAPPNAPSPQAPAASPPASPAPTTESDRIAQLTLLGRLHDSGVLTDEEFEVEKQRLLRG